MLGEIDLVRALAAAGIRSTVMAVDDAPARWSRHRRGVIEWVDPWRAPGEAVSRLLEFARMQDEPPALFYDGDWDVLLVSRHRDRLRPAFRFVVADAELVEDLVDKARFQELAARLELPVPAARVVSADAPTPPDLDLRFPLVVKPLVRQHATWRPHVSAKAVRFETAAELARAWPMLAVAAGDALVQELVPGPESLVESYHVYVDDDGEIAGEFTGRKLRTYPTEYGYTTALTTTRAGDVAALGRELVRRLGLRGVAKLDFKRAPDGGLRLLEVNPRFNLWHNPGARAGVNLPALVYADLTGTPRPEVRPARAGVRWCNVVRDWRAARSQGVGLPRWVAWALSCETSYPATWDDPLPLLAPGIMRLARRLR